MRFDMFLLHITVTTTTSWVGSSTWDFDRFLQTRNRSLCETYSISFRFRALHLSRARYVSVLATPELSSEDLGTG